MIDGYSGWMTKEMVANGEIVAERLLQEAYSLEFVGKSDKYVNGKILLKCNPVYGSDLIGNWSRSFEYPYVSLNIARTKRLSILDVGSGYSYYPFYVSSLGHNVTCYDIVDLSDLYKNTDVSFLLGDITKSDNNIKYDVIYCISVLEHIENKEAAINKMYESLIDGGKLILTLDCDLYDEKPNNTPNYSSLSKLLFLLNSKFNKDISEYNLSRAGLLTSADFNSEKWRLPWRHSPQSGQNFFDKVQSFFSVAYNSNTTPCIGVFVGTWTKS